MDKKNLQGQSERTTDYLTADRPRHLILSGANVTINMERTSGFDWAEYSVFGGMLAISAGIGIYFGIIKGGRDTVLRYLFGDKELSVLPIALSLTTGTISGTVLLGIPTEVYRNGTMVMVQLLSQLSSALITIFFIIPLYSDLQLISVFEYMEMRFGKTMRKLTSAIAALGQFSFLPMILYAPSLALNRMVAIDVNVLSAIICTVCLLYTTLGGVKAVVWTDTIQAFFMVTSVLAVLVLGIKYEGGLSHVWQSAVEGDRIEFFTFNFDPTKRISFLHFFLSQFCVWMYNFAFHPTSVQRYKSLTTLRQAQQSCIYMMVGVLFIFSMCGGLGIVLYAAYMDCEPLSAGMISKPDQILPLYILKFSKIIPGLPAIFLSGVVSAAMSSLSGCFNTFSGVIYADVVEDWFSEKPCEIVANRIMKLIAVVMGVATFCLVFMVETLGPIYEVSKSLNGSVIGVMFALFFMGTFLPWVNQKGAYVGGALGTVTMCWLAIGSNLAKASRKIRYDTKPMSVSGCAFNVSLAHFVNSTQITPISDVFYPFRISSFNYYIIGFLVTTIVGLIVSFATGTSDLDQIDPKLIIPVIRKRLGLKKTKENITYESLPLKEKREEVIEGSLEPTA